MYDFDKQTVRFWQTFKTLFSLVNGKTFLLTILRGKSKDKYSNKIKLTTSFSTSPFFSYLWIMDTDNILLAKIQALKSASDCSHGFDDLLKKFKTLSDLLLNEDLTLSLPKQPNREIVTGP